jgi:hypothetical protein
MKAPVSQLFRLVYKGKSEDGKSVLIENPPQSEQPANVANLKYTLEVIAEAVEARSKKLSACWTLEAAQDLRSMHGLDIRSELLKALVAEIVYEIENEVFNDIFSNVETEEVDFAAIPEVEYTPMFVGDNFPNITLTINRLASDIARTTRRGAGNFIVVSPMMVSVLQVASKSVFAPAIKEEAYRGPNGFCLAGTLNGSIKVYCRMGNYSAEDNHEDILIGYKGGNGDIDAGYFLCPYVMVMPSGVQVNPVTFQPVTGLMTRYGKKFSDTNYYRKLRIKNFSFM